MTMTQHAIVNEQAPAAVEEVQVGRYGVASDAVMAFLHRLRCVPAALWLERSEDGSFAAAVSADADGSLTFDAILADQAQSDARRRLSDALDRMPDVVRRIRMRVSSELAVFEGIMPEAALQRMRRAAHLAAFALAAHRFLDREDVELLYAPFMDLIPPPRWLLEN